MTVRGKSIKPRIAEYFHENADRRVGITEICEALQLNKTQVGNAIQRGIREQASWAKPLEIIIQGNSWVYHSNMQIAPSSTSNSADKRLFEELATTKSGAIIVQDEEGVLYRLMEIE